VKRRTLNERLLSGRFRTNYHLFLFGGCAPIGDL
jgi:hypothetical protein